MRSAARAIAWEFRRRHRWGLIAAGVYLLIVTIIRLLTLAGGQAVTYDSAGWFAAVVVVPLTSTFLYFLAVFTYGLSGDFAARQSMYPARAFTLPVTTAALAGWPMLYGTVVMAILWLATRLLARWPSDVEVPMIWPAFLAAVLLAWTQALTWMPYALRGLRVIVTVLWLTVIDAIIMVALELEVSEGLMVAFLAPQIPLGYLVACFAVARARRGDVPDWRKAFAWIGNILPRRRDRFPSPARALAWLEWKRHGWSLPALVGVLLPFELGLLFVFSDTPVIVGYTLAGALLTPPFMAGFAAATVRKSNPHGREAYGMTPFVAARPMTSAALIAAKLKMTIGSTLIAWLLVAVAIPTALLWSGTWPMVIEEINRKADALGTSRAIVVAVLGIGALMLATWKQLVQSLYIGLSGREWVVKSSVFLTLSFLIILGPLVRWISDNKQVQAALIDSLRWLPAVLVLIKMAAAAWIAIRLYDSRLLSDRTLVTGAACWLAAVLVLYGVLVWLADTPLIPRYFLALVAILAIPLARLSAAPLALAWNRHR